MLAFLGWNPGTNQELFSLTELEEAFTLERVGKAGAKFDAEKTKWFQQQHLRNKSNEEIVELFPQNIIDKYGKDKLITVCGLMKERATFVEDILTEGNYLLDRPNSYDETVVSKKWNDQSPLLMNEWINILTTIPSFEAGEIEKEFKQFLTTNNLGIGAVLPLFRLLVTGVGMGPSMFEIANFLGKEECIERMEEGLTKLN